MNPLTASSPQAKSTNAWWWIAVLVALIFALLYLAALREKFYVRMMYGPYHGLEFSGDLPSSVASELRLKSGGQLAVYNVSDKSAPALVLWAPSGERQWSRLMVPIQSYKDGSTKECWLRDLKLQKLSRSDEGFEVDITCNWELGGFEGGRIYLDRHYGFKDFKLSW
ncbi:MAG TPA: hypothetical protein VLD18_13180 [Verrucomicrobiae bacterium]|nr:hypothetical protein [Verrucomicrobiae bacterium]